MSSSLMMLSIIQSRGLIETCNRMRQDRSTQQTSNYFLTRACRLMGGGVDLLIGYTDCLFYWNNSLPLIHWLTHLRYVSPSLVVADLKRNCSFKSRA
eukprot:scaffold2472_cov209-Skeletonema_dohrnii-CCMP3373.AAC.5